MPALLIKEQPAPAELLDWLATETGFLQGLTEVGGEPTRLYDYQVNLMRSTSRFRAVLKSRQVGLSFAYAADGLAKAHLKPEHTSIFVSYNLDDAKEKIRHAAMLYETIPSGWKKKRVTDNRTELQFEDSRGRRSRLISLPCREPRGKGRADVHLDELPFMRNARRIYTAAVPIISRGGGSLTLGSSPLGKQDLFYDVMEGEVEQYPQFDRFRVAWWDCPEFCGEVAAARQAAPGMTTAERVERFGSETIKAIRASLDLESFQQEYELAFIDEATAFIPWDLILAASRDTDDLAVARSIEALDGLPIKGPLFGGYDVGRTRDASELILVEQVGPKRFRQRLLLTLERAPFSLQEATLSQLMLRRPDVRLLCVDESGLGMQLAEAIVERFRTRAEGVTFTPAVKSEIANGVKIALEDRMLELAADRDLMAQLHSVKKVVTAAGNVRLDADASEKHHADKFWALALALHASGSGVPPAAVAEARPRHDTYHAARRRSA